MITISAPGKLMLLGEHAVVYGQPCIVTAVGRRLTVLAELNETNQIAVNAPQVKETKFVDAVIDKFFSTVGKDVQNKGVRLVIRSEFTHNVGFGSSSAVSVATLKALSAIFQIPMDNRQIFDMAYGVTLAIQGVGSGFDIAAATYGGTLCFKKGGELIQSLPDHVPLVIGYTGVKADTPTIVREVFAKQQQYPEKVNRIFEAIGTLVSQGQEAIVRKDWERLGTLFTFNQEYLRDLGVSTEKLENLISVAKKAGALGAKLSGAGGGDCMIALYPDEAEGKIAIANAIRDAGGEVINVSPNAPGVRVETTDNQEEVFVVVDNDDNIIAYRSRYDCHHDKTLIHRTVGVLVYNNEGKLLLQKRSLTKDTDPGKWAISCAGHIEKGQTYEDAVARELKEELGIVTPVTFIKKFVSADDLETEMASLYMAVSNGPFSPNFQEVAEVLWVDPKELLLRVVAGEFPMSRAAKISLHEAGILP